MRVCHLSTVHSNNDVRIFVKECVSLAEAGHTVFLIANGKDREELGVNVIGIKTASNRLHRMLTSTREVYNKALKLNCDLYHFHDPELLLCGLKLKRKGKIVIYDSHEDVPAQIIDKPWIPLILRRITSLIYVTIETFVVKRLDAVVAATPYIAERFKDRISCVEVVNNYPKLDDIQRGSESIKNRLPIVCYVGGITENRGEEIMKKAISGVDAKLILAGACKPEKLKQKSNNIEYLGQIDRKRINELYSKAVIGLCLLKPTANDINSQPIKMYEYMAAGIPFICSDFPLWKEVVNKTKAGIYVKYNDVDAIRNAIIELLQDKDKAYEMGQRGYIAATSLYTWKNESEKLIKLYRKLLIDTSTERG